MNYRPKTRELAYLAGFVDGEGCIACSCYGNRNRWNVWLQVSQKDRRPIDWIYERWGGTIHQSNRGSFLWTYRKGDGLGLLLVDLIPFLVLKKDQAELAILLIKSPTRRDLGEKIKALKHAV